MQNAHMRVDGAAPRGLWPPVGGGLCKRVVMEKVLRINRPAAGGFLSLMASQAEGCGIALRAVSFIINAAFGGHVHIKYHNQDYHRPHRLRWMAYNWIRGSRGSPMNPVRLHTLRHFVALFP